MSYDVLDVRHGDVIRCVVVLSINLPIKGGIFTDSAVKSSCRWFHPNHHKVLFSLFVTLLLVALFRHLFHFFAQHAAKLNHHRLGRWIMRFVFKLHLCFRGEHYWIGKRIQLNFQRNLIEVRRLLAAENLRNSQQFSPF
jgi:hypothetical protein